MKYLIFLLLIPCFAFAQSDTNISVVSAEKLNIVYRGIPNPIKVAYPGADSIVVAAPGLKKAEGKNNYILTPGAGDDVTVNILAIMPDGTRKAEKKVFRVRGLPALIGELKGYECRGCLTLALNKKQLIETEVKVNTEDFLFIQNPDGWKVRRFRVSFPDKKDANFSVEGNKISLEIIQALNKLKKGDIVYIDGIVYLEDTTHITPKQPQPIVIELLD